MRVRTLELRLIGIVLAVCWAATAGLVLVAYRPGGPADIVVGVAASLPIVVAAVGVIWPPVTRGERSYAAMIWLGIGALLFLIPSMGGVLVQIRLLGTQTLLPSLEAAYPWLLALAASSLFSGFGIARRTLGGTSMRRRRLIRGVLIGSVFTAAVSGSFATAAIANEIALRDRDVAESRFGPTDIAGEPPDCDGPLAVGDSARLAIRIGGDIDGRPIGTVEISGSRAGDDFRWLAYVATEHELGPYGAARLGDRGWLRTPQTNWRATDGAVVEADTLDARILLVALAADHRTTAEDRGTEVIEGARARRCRVAIDGETFWAAFPQTRLLLGSAPDVRRWRGQLDYWVFMDGQLGLVAGTVNGDAAGLDPDAIQATVDVHMTATERDLGAVIYPPAR
jgi:hypothetical protein